MGTRSPNAADPLMRLLASLDAEPVEVAVLQPADPFLDMAGEDLRRRIFLTESETGEMLCLRPEFTIPVCLDHIRSRSDTPRRYAYLGEVFRQRRQGGNEFLQAGIEDLGEADTAAADARSVIDAHRVVAELLPDRRLTVTLGDQSIFEAVLAALGLPGGWRKRLARAFGTPSALAAALADLADPASSAIADDTVAALVMAGEPRPLVEHIEARFERAGLSPTVGRSPEEIAQRLIERSALRSVGLSQSALAALRAFLAIEAPLAAAPEALRSFARQAGLALSAPLGRFAARADRVAAAGLVAAVIRYDAAFGRPLDYYTGLVFEIIAADDGQVLAGGGRYDRLLTLLGAAQPIAGVGFSIWLDRVAALGGARP